MLGGVNAGATNGPSNGGAGVQTAGENDDTSWGGTLTHVMLRRLLRHLWVLKLRTYGIRSVDG